MQAAKAAAIRVAQEWIAQAAPVVSAPQRRVISSALGAGAATRERVRVLSTVGRGESKEDKEVLPSSGGDDLLRGLSPEQVRVVLSWCIALTPRFRYKASVCHPPCALLLPCAVLCMFTVRAQMTACLHRRATHAVVFLAETNDGVGDGG